MGQITSKVDTTEPSNIISIKEIFKSLLSHVKPVDFREITGMGEVGKINAKHLIVGTISELLSLATSHNWGLCMRHDFIYVYNGEYWINIDQADFRGFLGDVALTMGIDMVDARFYQFQEQLYKQFLSSANLLVPDRPKDIVLINLKNGTFEINSKESRLREFRQEDFLTYQLPFNYDEKATSPTFNTYLSKVLPEQELRRVLAEFISYIFCKNLKLEKCLLLYGSGANGKSVFFDIINALLGKENVSNFSLGNLAEEHNRALIANKLLNYGSEIRGSIEKDVFKQLASGEPIQARLKYKNSTTIDDYARLCFNCNELPQDVEHTEAYFRRFIIIPFNVVIPEGERDAMLAKRIVTYELSGVFNWVL